MNFRLEISLENDAFREDPGAEVARILAAVAARIETAAPFALGDGIRGESAAGSLTLSDVNGQSVGRAWVEGGGQ